MNFNPNDHLTKLQGKDYLEVKWRLVWFRELNPQGTIDTEELEYDTEREVEAEVSVWNPEKRRSEKVLKRAKGYARYRATVTDGKGARATGTKSENAAQFGDYGEKAETGSIGRALAALGYGTQFTGDEFYEGERIVDSPVERQAGNNGNHTPTASNATSAQAQAQNSNIPALIGSMKNRAKALGLATDAATFKALLQEATGEVLDEKDLTLARIAKINGHMARIERERKTA